MYWSNLCINYFLVLCALCYPTPSLNFSKLYYVYSITDPSWYNYSTALHISPIYFLYIFSIFPPLSHCLSHSDYLLSLAPSYTFWLTNLENWDLKDSAARSLDTRLPLSVKWRHYFGTEGWDNNLSTFLCLIDFTFENEFLHSLYLSLCISILSRQ